MFFAISILLTALIALICNAADNTKLEMRDRILHIRYVIFTAIYVIICVALFAKILDLVNLVISIPLVRNLLFGIIPPGNVSAGFYWVITLLCCLLLALIYLILINLLHRLWLLPLSDKNYLETKSFLEKVFNGVAALFYEVREKQVSLPPTKFNTGRWFRGMRIGFGCLLLAESLFIGLYLQMDWTFLDVDFFAVLVKSLFMLPILAYVLLHQIELFFAADRTKADILTETEEIGMLQQGDFSGLVKVYEQLYGDTALIAFYKGSGRREIRESLFAGVQEEQKAQSNNPALLEALCRNVACITAPRPPYINGLADLIDGYNVAAFDTPWGEFDPYYVAYIQHKLTLGKAALVICDNKLQVQRMLARLKSVFEKLNVVDSIWRIHSMDTQVDGMVDVLVCTEEEFLRNPLNEYCPKFNERLSIVVMLDSYSLLCRENAFSSRIFNFFSGRPLQYVFYVPENNMDICQRLQERIGCAEIQLREKSHSNSTAHLMFWRADSVYKPQLAISERLYEDFGVAYALAIIAAKYDVDAVNVLAPESVPLQTYYHLVTQKYSTEIQEDYLRSHAINLSTVVRNNDYSVADPAQLNFCVVYDELNNLLDVAQTWLSYGGVASSMLHIVSAPYMLRDYLASNVSTLRAETTGLQMLIPKDALGRRVPAMALLLRMRRGVSSQDILRFARDCGIASVRLEQILEKAMELALGANHHYVVENSFSFEECTAPEFDNGYRYVVTVTLTNEALYRVLCGMTEEFVQLVGPQKEILPIHHSDVYNHFLPHQQVVFGNNRYRIHTIADRNVHVASEGTVAADLYYTPLIGISDLKRTDRTMHPVPRNDKVVMSYFEAVLTRKITGYYAHPGMLDLTDKESTHFETLAEPVEETKTVPCLCLEFDCPLKDRSDKTANTICFLLKGAFATFLPKNYQDLLVFSKLDMDKVCQEVIFRKDNGLLPDPIPSDVMTGFDTVEPIDPAIRQLIPQVADDADVQPNTEDKIYIYIAQFSALDTGALTAIAEDLDRVLGTVQKYLYWSEEQKAGAPEYLRFGYNAVPGVFDTNATTYCLQKFYDYVPNINRINADDVQLDDADARHCSFCGKPVSVNFTELDDGRIMCPECRNHVTNSRDEIKKLLQEATATLEKYYGITLPSDIKVKFKSASAIRKRSGQTTGGRVLGFYDLRRREIWIERNGPEPCVFSTLVHELSHAWQHANINMGVELYFLEGHTSYVEVECLRMRKQDAFARFQERMLMAAPADDVYGKGYRYWRGVLSADSDKNIFHHMLAKFPKE